MMTQSVSPQNSEARSSPRTHLYLSATIQFDRVSAAIRIRDLSTGGARIEGSTFPAVGSSAHISRGALSAAGTVVWRDHKACGFRFDEPLLIDNWMPPRSLRDQQVVDEMVDAVKSGSAVLQLRQPGPPSKALRDDLPQRLAEELAYVGRLLESLGDDLCNEPLVVARHSEKLQNLDIAAQILGHVAALLVAEQPEQAVDAIGMEALRKRLLRATL